MTVPEILKKLGRYTRRFPEEAVRAALAQQEAITPELLRLVKNIADDPAGFVAKGESMLPVFALYLLAQFQEKRAFPEVVKMFHAPTDIPHELVGETVADGLHRIFASLYDGDPVLLYRLIENPEADEYVRDAAIRALVVLVDAGQMPREQVADYLRTLFLGKLERVHSFAWNTLVAAVGWLPAPELLDQARWAFDEGLADPTVAGFEDIARDAANPAQRQKEPLITDAIDEMQNWACFNQEHSLQEGSLWSEELALPEPEPAVAPEPRPAGAPDPVRYEPPKPVVRGPKIGRNDPCPCGSGRKYKKCCGP